MSTTTPEPMTVDRTVPTHLLWTGAVSAMSTIAWLVAVVGVIWDEASPLRPPLVNLFLVVAGCSTVIAAWRLRDFRYQKRDAELESQIRTIAATVARIEKAQQSRPGGTGNQGRRNRRPQRSVASEGLDPEVLDITRRINDKIRGAGGDDASAMRRGS